MYRSSLVRGPPGQSLRVDRRSRPPRHSTPSGGPAYELVGVRPRRKALPKAWAMKSVATSRKVSPPTSKQDRHVPTLLIEKIGRRVRKKETRNAARTPHRALRLISLPPSERHVSWNPCRFLKGCDALAAPLFLSLAKHHEDAQRERKKRNCPNITACVDVRSLVPGESGTKDTHTCDRTQ